MITAKEDLGILLDSVVKSERLTLLIVNLSLNEDAYEFIVKLDTLRLQRSTKFISIIISDLIPVSSAFENKIKILNRSLYILNPASKEDSLILLKDFENRFHFKLNDFQREELYGLSAGYIGLLKSLFLLRKDYPGTKFTEEFLISQESIIYRIKKILNDITDKKITSLSNLNFDKNDLSFFEKFGYMENGKIKNKLVKTYIQKSIKQNPISQIVFTKTEMTAYEYLINNSNIIIDREEIAKSIWGERWEEKYSDWAIDQLIHKIREKMKKTNSIYQIVTKKGQGFIFIKL